MISASPSSTPPPIAIFFQAFIAPVMSGELVLSASHTRQTVHLPTKATIPTGHGQGHTSSVTILTWRKFRSKISLGVPRPVTVGVLGPPPEPPIIDRAPNISSG